MFAVGRRVRKKMYVVTRIPEGYQPEKYIFDKKFSKILENCLREQGKAGYFPTAAVDSIVAPFRLCAGQIMNLTCCCFLTYPFCRLLFHVNGMVDGGYR